MSLVFKRLSVMLCLARHRWCQNLPQKGALVCCMQCCVYPGPQVTAAWRDMSSWFFAGSTSSSRGFLNTGSLQNHTHSHTHSQIHTGRHRHTDSHTHLYTGTHTQSHRHTDRIIHTDSHRHTDSPSQHSQSHTFSYNHPTLSRTRTISHIHGHSLTHSSLTVSHSHTLSHTHACLYPEPVGKQ